MDTVLIPRHGHGLSDAYNREGLKCDACDGASRIGNYCHLCKFTIHQKCVFVFYMEDTLEHPSHVGHDLKLLTTGAPDHTDPNCHLCGKNTKRILYHCSTCKLNLDIDCMLATMCAQAHLYMPWHPHPVLILDFDSNIYCDVCGCASRADGYFCPRCRLAVHKECVSVFDSLEITHPSHVRHPLKLLTDGAPSYTALKCHICGDDTESLLYHCDICKFNLDLYCAIRERPPVTLSNLKVHEHTLTLMPKLISFVCDACGTKGKGAPYVCLQCDSMIFHQDCARLPRVIHVNHHDHRVSYTYPLGHREWRCGVCWEEIDWSYGAYSCSRCPHYAIHSRCAIREDVWDGEELDGVLEEVEDIEPFKMNDDDTITHVAHDEHNLSLNKNDNALEESILCGACVRHIGSDTFYKCSDCRFILHETCAKLLQKKRHFLSSKPLTLDFYPRNDSQKCHACQQCCCDEGFMYSDENSNSFDLICSSITVPFTHGSHHHPLFYLKLSKYGESKTCQSCGIYTEGAVIGCIKCNYFLDFRCATLPLTVRLHRYDDHPLTLCYGEKSSGKYWCDICERETNPNTWFYTCEHCGVTLHILCVLGDLMYAKPGGTIGGNDAELLPNDRSSRPLCDNCHCRCLGPFILKDIDNLFLCSLYCWTMIRDWSPYWSKLRCPPWALELEDVFNA